MKCILATDQTLMEALATLAPDSSKTTHRSWLKEERVLVDGEVAKLGSLLVRKGQEVALRARLRYIGDLRVYFEDSHIVVIDKPNGLLSVATDFEKGDTAHSLLKNHYRPRRVLPVHRLDQETSGLMMFALSEQAHERLKIDFEKHKIEREYTAVVEGVVSPSQGTWESYLYEDKNYYMHTSATPDLGGRLAITHYQVQQVAKRRSVLLLTLETGRKNQIRVHCQAAGHPVVGDKKYGAVSNPIKRLCLHAHLLAFRHPITKQHLRFESPVPETFLRLM